MREAFFCYHVTTIKTLVTRQPTMVRRVPRIAETIPFTQTLRDLEKPCQCHPKDCNEGRELVPLATLFHS